MILSRGHMLVALLAVSEYVEQRIMQQILTHLSHPCISSALTSEYRHPTMMVCLFQGTTFTFRYNKLRHLMHCHGNRGLGNQNLGSNFPSVLYRDSKAADHMRNQDRLYDVAIDVVFA